MCSFYRIDNQVNYFDRASDEGRLGYYRFSTTYLQDVHVAVETYDPRVYAYGCRTSKVMAQMLVRRH